MAGGVDYVLIKSHTVFSTIQDYCDYHRVDYHTDTTRNGDYLVYADSKRLAIFVYRTKVNWMHFS
jgi:hypothetical protein